MCVRFMITSNAKINVSLHSEGAFRAGDAVLFGRIQKIKFAVLAFEVPQNLRLTPL